MFKDIWNALSNIKQTITQFASALKEDAQRWRGKIKGLLPDMWWLPNKVRDGVADIGGWACALSGICEVIDDCMGGNNNKCAEHLGGAAAGAVMELVGILVGGSATVAHLMARMFKQGTKLLKKSTCPAKTATTATRIRTTATAATSPEGRTSLRMTVRRPTTAPSSLASSTTMTAQRAQANQQNRTIPVVPRAAVQNAPATVRAPNPRRPGSPKTPARTGRSNPARHALIAQMAQVTALTPTLGC